MILLLLALAAGAQDAPEAPPEAAYEVTVWGEAAIRDARARVIRTFEAQGWRSKDKGDQVVFKGPRVWMGKGHLDKETGAFTFTQPRVTIAGLKGATQSGLGPAAMGDHPSDVAPLSPDHEIGSPVSRQGQALPTFAVQFGVPSQRKIKAKQERVFVDVREELSAYGAVIRETRFRERLAELPDRLDALWRDGVPLDPGPPLTTPEAKRAALLDFWATRSETPEGDAFTRAVEVWIDVTLTDAPITDAEASAAQAKRADGRVLPR